MAEETGGTEAQGAEATQPQGGEPTAAQGAATGTAEATPPATGGESVEDLRKKVADLEKDNRQYRQSAKAREEAEKAKAAEGLSEAERLRAENEALLTRATTAEKRAQEQSLRLSTSAAATRLGFRNPDIAVGLISSRVEYDDEGEPTNVEALLTALSKSDPYLLAQTDFGGGSRGTSPTSSAPDMNSIIRGAAASR